MTVARLSAADCALDNGLVTVAWPLEGGVLSAGAVCDVASRRTVPLGPDQAQLRFGNGQTVDLAWLSLVGSPAIEPLKTMEGASRVSEQLPGASVVTRFEDTARHFGVTWRAELRNGSRYLRLVLELRNTGNADLQLASVRLLDLELPGAATVGAFNGSPVVAGTAFLGMEHPLAQNHVVSGRVQCVLPCLSPLKPGEVFTAQAVVGFTDLGQLRRGFASYLERERAHPYRPFLHHNTWYNIGYRTQFTQADLMAVIHSLDRELVQKRGVKLDAFVLDDGWDDPQTLWKFNHGFPEGLGAATKSARQAGAEIGIWLSPWGGYGEAKQTRVAIGTSAGYETRDGSFSLAGPRYYHRFRQFCTDAVRKDGVVYFKFDGIGSREGPDVVDLAAGRDFEAMIRLIAELREISPAVFINQTTGTWPSPFWLLKVDSIWRGGEDHAFTGVGCNRERWITYRDAQTYKNVVCRGPLFPLNSLMVHGVIYAAHAQDLENDPAGAFANEVRSYFGSGTQLQELYLSPELLTQQNWTDLAEAARWSRSNPAMLCDTHWIGGDPEKLMVYGWAAWSPQKSSIVLRNPSDKPAAFLLDVGKLLELPSDAPTAYAISSPFPNTPVPVASLRAGDPVSVELRPFAVLVLEATPK